MHRIDSPNVHEDLFGPGKDGFHGGNPALNLPATLLDFEWFNAIQEEVCNVIEMDRALVKGERDQLKKVLTKLMGMHLSRAVDDWLLDASDFKRFFFSGDGHTIVGGSSAAAGGAAVTLTVRNFANTADIAALLARNDGRVSGAADATASEDFVRLGQVQSLIRAFNASEIGKVSYVPAMQATADHVPLFGPELNRGGAYADLYAFAVASGALVTEAVYASRPGCFSYGPGGAGGTTFRPPNIPGLVIKSYHNGNGTYTTNTTALMGAYLPDEIKSHNHEVLAGSSEQDAWNTFTNGRPADTTNVPTTYTGGNENTVRSVVLFPQMRYR